MERNLHKKQRRKLDKFKSEGEDYLKIPELIEGKTYVCKAENFHLGTWDGKSFTYLRFKCKGWFKDEEYHWDERLRQGTVKPYFLLDDEEDIY